MTVKGMGGNGFNFTQVWFVYKSIYMYTKVNKSKYVKAY